MDVLEYEEPKLAAAKGLRDEDYENVFQHAAKKTRFSPPPCATTKEQFTLKALQRLLVSQNDIQAINIKRAVVTRHDDECFWCDASSTSPNFQCPLHKHDKPATEQIPQLPLALRSLPPEVGLCTSSIPGAGCGICAKRKIPFGAWIGPYAGNFLKPEDLSSSTDTSYMWEIFKEGELAGYIDGSDVNVTSWMRFIRCARHRQEQNLFAFQYLGKIFYRAFKEILPGEEMLVWYDEKYPQYLGIPWITFDLGAVIPNGTSSHPDEIIVVSPHDKDNQPLNGSTQDSIFPSPPPSPLSKPSSPWKSVSLSPNGKRSPRYPSQDERSSYMKSVPKVGDNLLKKNNKNLAMDTEQHKYSLGDKRMLAMNSVSEITTKSSVPLRDQSPQPPQRDMNALIPQIPYQCGHCAASFSNASELRAHAVIHARNKPYKCGYCSRSFNGTATLNNHIRSHYCRGQLLTRQVSG